MARQSVVCDTDRASGHSTVTEQGVDTADARTGGMERLTHHGRETAYRVYDRGGSGDGLLLLHGSGGNAGVWKAQARLADDRPIVACEFAGHGESDDVTAQPGAETIAAYATDAVAVARETGCSTLVGNSLGGAVALQVALDDEFDPDRLVLAGTGAKLAVLDDLLAWLADDFERAVSWLHGPDRLFHDPDDTYREASERAMRETGQRVTERDFRTAHTFDVRDRLDNVDVPALALVGEYDRLTPPAYHEYLADHLPTCESAVIENAAHLAMLERPTAFNAAVSSFLERH